MINKQCLYQIKPIDFRSQIYQILKQYERQFSSLQPLQYPKESQLHFQLAIKKIISTIQNKDYQAQTTEQLQQRTLQMPCRFSITEEYLKYGQNCNKASYKAIHSLELNSDIPNQLQIDKKWLKQECCYKNCMQLFKKSIKNGMFPHLSQDNQNKKVWRKIKPKEQNILLNHTTSQQMPSLIPKMQLLLTFSAYSPINGQKNIQFQLLSNMPISTINKLKNFCIIPCLAKTMGYKPQGKYQQFLWNNGKMFTQKKLTKTLQDQRDSGSLQTPWDIVRIQLGRPMIYRHLNGCDHMLIVKDCVLATKQQLEQEYPKQTFRNRIHIKHCEGCEQKLSKFALVSKQRTQFICQQCCQQIGIQEDQKLFQYIQH